jgi:hypothetical protein
MNRRTLEKIFVLVVFGLVYTIIAKGVTLTGYSIALPALGHEQAPALSHEPSFFIDISQETNAEIKGLSERSQVIVMDGENKYSFAVTHIVQDFQHGDEFVSVLVNPGNKQLMLRESGRALIDFNNDGVIDVLIRLKSVAKGKAVLSVESR